MFFFFFLSEPQDGQVRWATAACSYLVMTSTLQEQVVFAFLFMNFFCSIFYFFVLCLFFFLGCLFVDDEHDNENSDELSQNVVPNPAHGQR